MAYLTELHCHSAEVSNCATAPAEVIVDCYLNAGYTSVTLMNHLSRFTFDDGSEHKYTGSGAWEEKISFFMNGVEALKRAADGRLNILWGIELRSDTDNNDYLIHGLSADFLRANPDIMKASVKDVSQRVHRAGGLIYQAHPFRNSMCVKKPDLLDGIEVFNGHIGHDSRNDIALMWAKKFNLKMLSGTDFHHDYHKPNGGIITDAPISSNEELLSALKSGEYSLLNSGTVPKKRKTV